MILDTFDLLKKYSEIAGPTGHEKRVQMEFMEDLKVYADARQLLYHYVTEKHGP